MPHGAIFKTTRDILKVGDIWRYCVSALELQNAETKRVAKTGGSCRQQMSSTGQTRRSGRTDTMEGVVTATIGYATHCIPSPPQAVQFPVARPNALLWAKGALPVRQSNRRAQCTNSTSTPTGRGRSRRVLQLRRQFLGLPDRCARYTSCANNVT